MDQPTSTTPIACDMTSAPDTGPERMMEYRRLFAQALLGRERTAEGIRFRFRAGDGIEAWVRDLAAREKACCPFFDFSVNTDGDEVHWDATVIDDDIARDILDEFYTLPDTVADGVEGLESRLGERGLHIEANPAGTVKQVRHNAVAPECRARPDHRPNADRAGDTVDTIGLGVLDLLCVLGRDDVELCGVNQMLGCPRG